MSDWKVYAQCCRRPKGKRIVEVFDVDECIDECVRQVADEYDWDSIEDTDETVNKVYETIWEEMSKRYKKNEYLCCGDYLLVHSTYIPDDIPTMVGFEVM